MIERVLMRALTCLEPIRDQFVIVGGTAQRLFPQHELGRLPGFELLTTEDVDIATPLHPRIDEGVRLGAQLENAGFREEVVGAEQPSYRWYSDEPGEHYLQFITQLHGDGYKKSGERDPLLNISGIRAEKLRHVNVLLHEPWQLTLIVAGESIDVRVVNPVSYLVQKLLIMRGRGKKRGKDLVYVFDTLTIFSESLGELGKNSSILVPRLSAKSLRDVRSAARDYCFSETDASREAAVILAAQRPDAPSSSQIVGASRLGLRRVLSGLISDL